MTRLLFFHFGSHDAGILCQAVASLQAANPKIDVLKTERAGDYVESNESLPTALKIFALGGTRSLLIRYDDPQWKWTLLFAPKAPGSELSLWNGSSEFRGTSWKEIVSYLKQRELHFVAVSEGEPLDLEDHHLSVDTFPWEAPRLVVAAVANDVGEYEERLGIVGGIP